MAVVLCLQNINTNETYNMIVRKSMRGHDIYVCKSTAQNVIYIYIYIYIYIAHTMRMVGVIANCTCMCMCDTVAL